MIDGHLTKRVETMRVVIFDGVCNLCNKFVNLIIHRDKHRIFMFSPIGSEFSKKVEERFNVDLLQLDTVVLVENEKVFIKASAVIKICSNLGFPFNLLVVFFAIPKFFRNMIYDIIARNRYGIFGKRESCMVPNSDIISRFIY